MRDKLRIGITGASGFLGARIVAELNGRGHKCTAFSRSATRRVPGCVETRPWPAEGAPDLRGLDAMINLAGESILGRWTAAKKRRVRESRVDLTERLVAALPGSEVRALVSASATGFYGHRGDEELDEDSPAGKGFVSEICVGWEQAALGATSHGVRVALPRIGVVLAPEGGAMRLMRPVFRLGLGGRLGDGRQWMPWVRAEDVATLFAVLVERDDCAGPFNATAPEPVTNAEFTRALAASLHRPAWFHVPAGVIRFAMGEAAALLLDSARVLPARTEEHGFQFRFRRIEEWVAEGRRSGEK